MVSLLKKSELEFLGRFFLLFFIPYILLHVADVSPLSSAIAGVESSALSAAGFPASSSGSLLFVGESVYEIVPDCTGLVMVILLFALLYSTPLDSNRRLRGLLVFTPLLLAFNLARLAVTLLTGAWFGPTALEGAHVLLWFVDSAVVLLAWGRAAGVKLI